LPEPHQMVMIPEFHRIWEKRVLEAVCLCSKSWQVARANWRHTDASRLTPRSSLHWLWYYAVEL